ncbi:MAG: hypothetical protein MHM6MM_004355 [Cercozoa sp. M6MM]
MPSDATLRHRRRRRRKRRVLVKARMSLKYKVIVLGDCGVGKTSVLSRFVNDSFDQNYCSTIGLDYLSRTLFLPDGEDTINISFNLWDTAGQERYRSLVPTYLRDAAMALLVCDLTNARTLESLQSWLQDVVDSAPDTVLLFVVGNKCDLDEASEVSIEMLEQFAQDAQKQHQLHRVPEVVLCSAKTGKGVNEMFEHAAAILFKNKKKGARTKQSSSTVIRIKGGDNEGSTCAC